MKIRFLLIIVLAIVALYIATVKVSESNLSCGYCHNEQRESWLVSSHKSISCKSCHIEPGIAGSLKAQKKGLHDLFVSITRGNKIQPHEEPIPISTQNCKGCHSAILYFNEMGWDDLPENSLKGQGLIMAHRTHIEKYQLKCVECHRGIVHRDPAKIGKYSTNWPFMKTDCGPCHDGSYSDRFQVKVTDLEDKSKCTVCHPSYVPPHDFNDLGEE